MDEQQELGRGRAARAGNGAADHRSHERSSTTAGVSPKHVGWDRGNGVVPPPGKHGRFGAVATLIAAAASTIAIFGPIAFATLHSVYAQFYEPFGLTPEDTGVDSTRVLTTSLTAVVFAFFQWLPMWVFVFGIPFASLVFIAATADPAVPRRGMPLLLAISFGTLLVAVGIWVAIEISDAQGVNTDLKTIAWLAPAAVPLAVMIAASRGDQTVRLRKTLASRNAPRLGLVTVVLAGALVTGSVIVNDVSNFGKKQAELVQRGQAVVNPELPIPAGSGPHRALDVRAVVANVHWLQARPATISSNDCLMYFGNSGSFALLWNVQKKALIRAPDSTIVITTTTRTRCHP